MLLQVLLQFCNYHGLAAISDIIMSGQLNIMEDRRGKARNMVLQYLVW